MSSKALYLEYWKVLQNSEIREQQPPCSSFTVVAVINTMSQSSLGKKGFLWFYTSASLKEGRAGIQPGAEAQTMEQHCMHACFPWLIFLIWTRTICPEVALPTSGGGVCALPYQSTRTGPTDMPTGQSEGSSLPIETPSKDLGLSSWQLPDAKEIMY